MLANAALTEERLMTASPGEIMTIDELAGYLKVSKSTLCDLVQHGGLPGMRTRK
jgi:hypothetical protein